MYFINNIPFTFDDAPEDYYSYFVDTVTNLAITEFKSIAKCYSNGIDLDNVVNGLIKAKQEKLKLSFELACEADKQKIDIKKTVINTVAHVGKEK